MMRNQLREALEDLKEFYIKKLLDAGVFDDSEKDPSSLSLSELERMYHFYVH